MNSRSGLRGCYIPGISLTSEDLYSVIWNFEGTVSDIFKDSSSSAELRDVRGCSLIPLAVDQHIHGFQGANCLSSDGLDELRSCLLAQGTECFVPSSVAASPATISSWVSSVSALRATSGRIRSAIPGVHLEGPFLSKERAGAHDPNFVYGPNLDLLKRICDGGPSILSLTVCPLGSESSAFIRWATSRGIRVSLGHTNATYDEASLSVDAGASCVTHIMNCMLPVSSREPSLLGLAMNHDLYVELIPNPEMVHPTVWQVVRNCVSPKRLILISDALASSTFSGQKLSRSGLSYSRNGQMLGGSLSLLQLVPALKSLFKGSLDDLILATSQNALRHLGLPPSWPLAVGSRASVALVDSDWRVVEMVNMRP